jgi:hypothetical protein
LTDQLNADERIYLPACWRRPFERSFGLSLAHVCITAGESTDRYLASRAAIAVATDPQTVCLTRQLFGEPFEELALLLGHELAHTVQLGRRGDDPVEFLEAEAWEATRAALRGQRYPIKGGSREALEAAGLYRTDDARDFIETFGIDPLQVPKGNTAKIDPLTFEKILDLMLDKFKNEDDFIIDAHGNHNGFLIPIIKGEDGQATTANLATLPKILDLRSELTNAGDNLKELQRIVRDKTLDGNPVSPGDPNNKTAVDAAVQANKQKIEREITRLKGLAKVQDETAIARVVKKINDLKNKQRNRIELRACNMGILQAVMDFYRQMFNAKILRAANLFSAFGHFVPAAPRSDASYNIFLKQHGKAFAYAVNGGKFALDYIPLPGAKADTPSAATSDAAVTGWIKRFLGSGTNVKVTKFPSHFLLMEPPAFPQETNYRDHIKESKATP